MTALGLPARPFRRSLNFATSGG